MTRNLLLLSIAALSLFACKGPEARRPVRTTSGTFIKESAERNKILLEQEEKMIATIIEQDTAKTYLTSDSGFWYYYNVKDSLPSNPPKFGDDVTFTYDIKTLNGKLILSESDNGVQNYKIDQSNQELISGIRDGLKLMKVGETVTFLFPSYKAYGYYGIENKLGTNVPVRSTVTLKTITTQENE
ncbi:gliding motility-associated peptidyl-prolyl isomerase GldI [Aureisphaera galaxeae]|uniref:gliding motility-associated peptidyl-prolyl isomerase GldI n=1 Tax=Aureisphaera galaxeae TaxID=1538023 RepID=UPI00234FBF16|nr:gliding motility-associated peptidyl-prolyl isomerase GldI [Aureisphaera galaxeae]MDC8003472.1 gliding motility-associated peptidyl-prolyl isomerase GldI [Aureisphaera galaxeae]